MSRFELGDEVRDTVTGFQGIVIGRTQWLHGCDRLVVQPKVGKDNKMGENATFDEPQLELVKAKKVAVAKKKPGEKTGGFNIKEVRKEVMR